MAQRDLERVEKAAVRAAEAREALRVAILIAIAAGETQASVANRAGLSPSRIQQIVRESRERPPDGEA